MYGTEKEIIELFRFQSRECAPYREYIELIGCNAEGVDGVEKIPFLPIELFKSHKIYCGVADAEQIFTSSSTTGAISSKHYMASLEEYERSFTECFEHFFGSVEQWSFYALLPSYLEREGSSLIYMMDRLISRGGGGFYLYDHQKLVDDLKADTKKKMLFGVSYALLDLAEALAPKLKDTVVMETGGMKGRREEMPKGAMHEILKGSFGVESIASEFGMAEMTSQCYSFGEGIFRMPPSVRVLVRDLNNPFDIRVEGRGAMNIIDLNNRYSCAFLQTEDLVSVNGDCFEILGRVSHSDIRGCNLLVDNG